MTAWCLWAGTLCALSFAVASPRRRLPTILQALADPLLFGRLFPRDTWRPWFLCAAALFGLTHGLDAEDQAFILRCLGGRTLPTTQALRGFLIVGRRGGKSRFAAVLAVYLACFRDYSTVLARGERGIGMVLAPDRRQSRVIFRYIEALIDAVPMLAAMVESRTREAINLRNGISIEVHTSSYRAVRGYTIVFAITDEGAFLPTDDSAEPDTALLAALAPAMSTVPGALLLMISTPYARRGEMWKAYEKHFGKDDPNVLVWNADTKTMNPLIDQALIEQAYAEDEASARAEYGAEFRRDIEGFIAREAIEAVTIAGRIELPPNGEAEHVAFVDPAGGSGADSMTLAIAHAEERDEQTTAVLDLVREVRPPFSPEQTVAAFCNDLERYRVSVVSGDRYAGEWPREQFRQRGIEYEASELAKSDIYRELLPLLNSRRVELLDDRRLLAQLGALERRTARGGKDSIDHAPRGHDDVCNSASGALVRAAAAASRPSLRNLAYPLFY